MNDWLHNLPVRWMALVIFAMVYLATAGIFAIIMALAKSERVHAFKRVSGSLLSPLGTIFGLLVVFSVVEVWSDMDRAKMAVDREASAIRMVVLLATSFPGEPEAQIRNLLRRHIDEAVLAEWPTMAKQAASLKVAPPALAELLRFTLSLTPRSEGQILAQREIVKALEDAMEARRERINRSRSSVNWVKWTCIFAQAGCALIAVAMVHSDNRRAAARDGYLCNRSGGIRAPDRQPRPAVQWRDFCQTRCASASQAGVIIRSALEGNPFLTISPDGTHRRKHRRLVDSLKL